MHVSASFTVDGAFNTHCRQRVFHSVLPCIVTGTCTSAVHLQADFQAHLSP